MSGLDASPSTLRAYRDTIIRALVASPGGRQPFAYLVELGDIGAALHVAGLGQPLVFLFWEGDAPEAMQRLLTRIQHVVAGSFRTGSHIAVIGGDAHVPEILRGLNLDKRVSLHHVGLDGHVWTRGRALGPLSMAARELAESGRLQTPLDQSEFLAERARFQQVATVEDAFIRAMAERQPRATVAIIAVCAVLFGLKLLWGNSNATDLRMGAVDGDLIRAGEWWRLLAGAFLHADVMHIGANMWSLWALGRFLERLFGTPRFVVLYGLAAFGGALLSSSIHEGASVGASGAVFGLLGALAAVAFRRGRVLPPTVVASLKQSLWQPIVLNVFISLLPGVDALAHAGGAAVGLGLVGSGLLVRGIPNAGETVPRREGAWRLGALATAVVALGCVVMAIVAGRPWELVGAPTLEKRTLPGVPFTIDLPYGLHLQGSEPKGNATQLTFGDLHFEPMTIEVLVEHAPGGELDEHDRAELLRGPEDAKLEQGPDVEAWGGHDALFVRYRFKDGTPLLAATTYRDGFRFLVVAQTTRGLSPAWENAFPRIVGSIAHRE